MLVVDGDIAMIRPLYASSAESDVSCLLLEKSYSYVDRSVNMLCGGLSKKADQDKTDSRTFRLLTICASSLLIRFMSFSLRTILRCFHRRLPPLSPGVACNLTRCSAIEQIPSMLC